MEHVVFFPAPDGTPAFRRFSALEEAVRFVEHLRNVENVSEASVHELNEVPLSFKAWYRVEIPQGEDGAAPAAAPQPVQVQLPAETSVSIDGPVPAPAGQPPAVAPEGTPTTIAEAIESYEHQGAGSATGIVVPDQPMVHGEQFAMPPAPAAFGPSPQILPSANSEQAESQLETSGRRERGMGFFSR